MATVSLSLSLSLSASLTFTLSLDVLLPRHFQLCDLFICSKRFGFSRYFKHQNRIYRSCLISRRCTA